jgi:hypothetical protein
MHRLSMIPATFVCVGSGRALSDAGLAQYDPSQPDSMPATLSDLGQKADGRFRERLGAFYRPVALRVSQCEGL